MSRSIIIPLITSVIMIAIFSLVSLQISAVLIFIPGTIVTLIIYFKTFYKRSPDPDRFLSLYLLALSIQFVHFIEEYVNDFTVKVPALIGMPPNPEQFWIIFNMVAYSIFIIGGIIIFRGIKELMIIPLFFIVVGVIMNSVGHILISLYTGGYFPGLYTAIIYVLLIPSIISRMREAI